MLQCGRCVSDDFWNVDLRVVITNVFPELVPIAFDFHLSRKSNLARDINKGGVGINIRIAVLTHLAPTPARKTPYYIQTRMTGGQLVSYRKIIQSAFPLKIPYVVSESSPTPLMRPVGHPSKHSVTI